MLSVCPVPFIAHARSNSAYSIYTMHRIYLVCVLRAVSTTVRKRRTGMLPRSRPGSRRIAVWQRSAGRTGQTLPRTHGGDTQGPSCPTTTTPGRFGRPRRNGVGHAHRLYESRRDKRGDRAGPQRFHRGVATRSEPAPRRPPQHPHPTPASARYRSRKPGRNPPHPSSQRRAEAGASSQLSCSRPRFEGELEEPEEAGVAYSPSLISASATASSRRIDASRRSRRK